MTDRRLLRIIYEESENSSTGEADGQTVVQRYGPGFHDAFKGLIQAGYISERGTASAITLTASGRRAAERL